MDEGNVEFFGTRERVVPQDAHNSTQAFYPLGIKTYFIFIEK